MPDENKGDRDSDYISGGASKSRDFNTDYNDEAGREASQSAYGQAIEIAKVSQVEIQQHLEQEAAAIAPQQSQAKDSGE